MALLATSGKSGELRVVSGHIEGRLWLQDGQLVSSAVGRDHDHVDAMFELLRLSEGTFVFKDGVEAAEPEAPTAVEPIVRQAQERLQEWRQIEAVVPTLEHRVRLVPELPAPEVTLSSDDWTLVTAVALAGTVRGVVEELQVNYFDACRGVKRLVDAGLVLVEAPRVRGASAEPSHGVRRNGTSAAVVDPADGGAPSLPSSPQRANGAAPTAPIAHAEAAHGSSLAGANSNGAVQAASLAGANSNGADRGSSLGAVSGNGADHGSRPATAGDAANGNGSDLFRSPLGRDSGDDGSSPFASIVTTPTLAPSATSFSFEPAILVPARRDDSTLAPSAPLPTTARDTNAPETDQVRRRRVFPDWRLPKDAEPVRVLRHEPEPEDNDTGELAVVRHLFLNPAENEPSSDPDWDGWQHTAAGSGSDETEIPAPAPIRAIRSVAPEPARSDEAVTPPAASFSRPDAGAASSEPARGAPAASAESSHEQEESINRGLLLKFLSSVKP